MYFQLEKKLKAYVGMNGKNLTDVPHMHSHIEIVLVYSGRSHGYADERHADMDEGDLFIAFPNQIHYYLDKTDEVRSKVVILSPDMCPEFSKVFKSSIPATPVLKGAMDNPRIVSAIETIVEFRKDTREFIEPLMRGCTLVLLSEIFRNIDFEKSTALSADLVKDIINYCYDNYMNDISLKSVADALHISRFYVSHLFGNRLKVGFLDYINSLRIRAACEMLKSGDDTITEISSNVGYNSARTFNRCFMAIKGMTPKEYRKKAIEKRQNKQDKIDKETIKS